jgi:hypothetical protein
VKHHHNQKAGIGRVYLLSLLRQGGGEGWNVDDKSACLAN